MSLSQKDPIEILIPVPVRVLNVLQKHNFHPYKVTQELSEGEFDGRVQFCEELQLLLINDNLFAKNIIFLMKLHFCLMEM